MEELTSPESSYINKSSGSLSDPPSWFIIDVKSGTVIPEHFPKRPTELYKPSREKLEANVC